MRKSLSLLAACLAACVCLAGCFKTKQDVTLNPDGSGKVTYAISIAHGPNAANDMAALKDEARKEAARIMYESKGVTAWKDVTFAAEKDGRTTFVGTAYFPDIARLKLGGTVRPNIAVKYTPAAANAAAQLELTMEMENAPTPAEAPKWTDEQLLTMTVDAKALMAQRIPMMEQVLPDFQAEWTFMLPGTVEKCVNFQPVAGKPNTVRIACDGKQILEAMKAFAQDDAYVRAMIAAGMYPSQPPPELLNEKLFGTKGPVMVSFKPGGKPLFDFAAESAAPKQEMPAPTPEAPATK